MIENLIQYFQNYVQLTEEEIDYIKQSIPVKEVPKNEVILRQGDVSKEFFFTIKGCVRLYYIVNGEEKTAFFYCENEFVSSYESFTKQLPAKHSFECIENSDLAVINFETAYKLLEKFPKFEFLARTMMEQELIVCQEIIANLITLSPEQRYLKLRDQQPDLLQRIPQYHLATFLGVRPESLSRIRKRLIK
ncbi:MAG: Crp/Fnr family transcriptional regulator [Cyclobacteriaceae bacterium]